MGTRSLIEVKLDGEIRVAQYGQWDGYPTGQGDGIARFLAEMNEDRFKAALRNTHFITDDGDAALIEECRKSLKYPWLSRDAGSKVLGMIDSGQAVALKDSREFKSDKLFCEFHYLIDMDERTVTIDGRRGKHTVPFSEWTSEKMSEIESCEYQPA